jgi:hypothetical protein
MPLMYSRLYDSMATWYSQWFSRESHRHVMASLALTVLMSFNFLSVINVLAIGGSRSALDLIVGNRSSAFSLFAAVTVFHFAFAVWRSTQVTRTEGSPPNPISKKIAAYYMAASVIIFFSSSIVLVALRP